VSIEIKRKWLAFFGHGASAFGFDPEAIDVVY